MEQRAIGKIALAAGGAAALAAAASQGVDPAQAVVTSGVSAGTLTVSSDAGDDISIACSGPGGNVRVNSNDPESGTATCASVTQIVVNAGPNGSDVNLVGVSTGAGFPASLDGDITVNGGAGADEISGSAFADSLLAGGGDDNFSGGAGGDTLIGATGNDTITPGSGADSVDGGADTDRVSESSTVSMTLSPTQLVVGADTDTLVSIDEGVLDTSGTGAQAFNSSAFTGPVTLSGRDGNDTLTAGVGADSLNGGNGNDSLSAGGGADTLVGAANNDTLSGAGGTDRVADNNNSNFTLTDLQLTGFGVDSLDSIDQASLVAGGSANLVDASGFSGPVTLSGGLSADTLIGGPSSDSLIGGDGADITTAVGSNLTLANTLLSGAGSDTLTGVELASLSGTAGPDVLNASAFELGAVTLSSGAGDDTLHGPVGAGSVDGGPATDLLVETGQNFVELADFFANVGLGQSLAGIEQASLTGTSTNDVLNANAFGGPVTIAGLGGNDTVFGGLDSDSIDAGEGFDLLAQEADTDFTFTGGSVIGMGTDSVASIERAGITGGPSANLIDATNFTGDGVALGGLDGADTLIGSQGSDTIDGGSHDDLLSGRGNPDFIDASGGQDRLVESEVGDAELTNTRFFPDGDTLNGVAQAELLLADGGHAVDASGFSGPVTLEGADGPDTLTGGPSADQLLGNDGDDSLIGKGGSDSLSGVNGNDKIDAVDGAVDSVDCGANLDQALVDPIDQLLACETVTGNELPPPPPQGQPQGQQPAGAADTKAPKMAVTATATVTPKGEAQFTLTCPGDEAVCQGALELTTTDSLTAARRKRRAVRLGRKGFNVGGGKKATIKLKLSKKGFKALKARGRLKATLKLTVADAARNSASTTKKLTLRASKRKRV